MSVYLRTEKEQRSQFLSFPREGHLYYPSVIHCGRQRNHYISDETPRTHEHSVFHILLFCEGENEFIFDGKSIPSVRGLLTLCSPGNSHNFYPLLKGETEYSEITFEYISREKRWDGSFGELFSRLFREEKEVAPLFILDDERMSDFLKLQMKLQDCLENGGGGELYKSDLFLQDIFRFIDDLRKKEAPFQSPGGKKDRTALLEEMIRARFPGKIHLDELAGELGWSKSYMIKQFRLKYGITPMEFDRRLRIDAAADLIVSSNRKMEDIALSLGFYDVFHFIRTFKKYKGVTPGRYV